MGLFDSIYAELRCPRCGYSGEMETQTKIDPAMDSYRVGDRIGWEGILHITFKGEATCPECRRTLNAARRRAEETLRRRHDVPEAVERELWAAWPDGMPVLSETKLHLAERRGEIPAYSDWCAAQGYDPKARSEQGEDPWMEYLTQVERPILVSIRAPDGYLRWSDEKFREVEWRDLLNEELHALAERGDAPDSDTVPALVEVKDRILVSVTVREAEDSE